MSTLAVVEEILRETAVPMSVREIVERAGARLPSKSKTPDTVVARDLSMDIKKKGEASLFARTSPGRYTLRALAASVAAPAASVVAPAASVVAPAVSAVSAVSATNPVTSAAAPAIADELRDVSPIAASRAVAPQPMAALPARKPAVSAPAAPARVRPEGDVGNGLAG